MSAAAEPVLDLFHEDIRAWFADRFGAPTEAQTEAWPAIASGRSVLLAAPTGSGKTLAAFLWAIDRLWRRGLEGTLARGASVLYVSPLKALSHDVKKNLEEPLREIRERAFREHLREADIAVAARTGDTPAWERESMRKEPPHLLITTPESLYLMLTSTGGRRMLGKVETVIVDEVHALAGNRRGAHLSLSLERLEALVERPLQRIGLSATQKPLERVAEFLTGDRSGSDPAVVVDAGRRRDFELAVEIPPSGLSAVMELEVWEEVYARLLQLIGEHRTTLIFTGTRRLAERMAHRLRQSLGEEAVAAHHGSMSRERRLDAEQRLKSGALKAMVATASLELGIDIGSVDLVVQMGSPKTLNAFLQRIGRSRHHVGGRPKGRIFPLTRDELVEAGALLRAVRRGELDALCVPEAPLDMLAQQMVAETACREWDAEGLYQALRRADPYRNLPRERFLEIAGLLAQGYTTRRGRRGAHLHYDAVNGRLRGRPGARLTALLNGGAIPDTFDYEVRLEPGDQFLGTVNEDFAVESMAGDVFLLGNGTWRILRVEDNAVRVADAQGEAPSLPFWLGEAPGRSAELSEAVSELRREVEARLGDAKALRAQVEAEGAGPEAPWKAAAAQWLREECSLDPEPANLLLDHLAAGLLALEALPTRDLLVAERFFDEGGGMHLVLHCPLGSRVNRAFGLALRKRFCRKFNFELQAAATEEGLILSLGATHSFPLEEVFQYLRADTARPILEQAVLQSPLFEVRWRWNASRFLAIPRRRGDGRVPPALQRLQAQDLAALVFPDQLACPENLEGDREIPDHPLVRQTLEDCLHEAMDADGLMELLRRLESGECRVWARDLSEPSPLAQELLSARPYAFLDDAPLEERRTRAVASRGAPDPAHVAAAALDPEVVREVGAEVWPAPRSADELHDALWIGGFLTESEIRTGGANWSDWLEALRRENRVGSLRLPRGEAIWVASERYSEARAACPQAAPGSVPALPPSLSGGGEDPDRALRELLRSRLEISGVVAEADLRALLDLPAGSCAAALAGLENEGFAFRGEFLPGLPGGPQWCERRLLLRMRQRSVRQRRKQAVAVPAQRFQDFLFQWQGFHRRSGGPDALAAALEMLAGYEAPAALWEREILPARVPGYEPAWLDAACHSGRFGFARLRAAADGPLPPFLSLRHLPLAFYQRPHLRAWKRLAGGAVPQAQGAAKVLEECLEQKGALFADELFAASRLLPEESERALRALLHTGAAGCDGFSGLRALMRPARPARSGGRSGWSAAAATYPAGRFFLLPAPRPPENALEAEEDRLFAARMLLKRYGVVFRKLAERGGEGAMPPWRELRRALLTLEDRGEARGGRFLAGISGEQFALPEALEILGRENPDPDAPVVVPACDPANLQGILTPEKRVPAHPKNFVLFQGGLPRLAWEGQSLRELTPHPDPAQATVLADRLRRHARRAGGGFSPASVFRI